jgi:dynein heavy chain
LQKIQHNTQFEWLKHLKSYSISDDIYIDCMLARFPYGYEYQGTVSRLVATPLTDRCYITLMNALKLGIGGAAYGPPGTGKTETVKDLAKIIAKQCVILNCSGSMDHIMI